MSIALKSLRNWAFRQDGAVTAEFVIAVPFILSLFFASVDVGISMLRQVMLDRAMDLAVREVRLGRVPSDGSVTMAQLICARTALLPDCINNITVEMQPVDTQDFTGLTPAVQCVNRELDLTPAVTFNVGAGANAQELMLIRTCVAAEPLIRMTGFFTSMPINSEGQYVVVSRGVFVNEPS
ncbi:MAG: Tad secretion system minor pilin component TadE [Roseibaca calidilacus]|uniref:Tad secretion system minor pilin component TadE n=1 Tax=Roseibaca calidilacus TaxID=1666912 RepID=A0A0P7WF23_9RHOB|nr:TadE/TadG family type IV pilus assembly protein [Roseibaca calidilacus]KPP92635.1 MAG: Tad secretion system minor pilin component TadE [Roseibaca calidilacus]CUX80293.1 TadE-like protein [Roseibaca calidilacus]